MVWPNSREAESWPPEGVSSAQRRRPRSTLLRSQCFICGLDPLRRLFSQQESSPSSAKVSVDEGDGQSLPEAVQAFRRRAEIALRSTAGTQGVKLADAACQLVEAVFLGMHRHLPEVRAVVVPAPEGDADEAASLSLVYSPAPLLGEIATRTRIPVNVQLNKEVHIVLRRLHGDVSKSPLVLEISGLDMPRLPDVVRLRELLREALGENYTAEGVYAWWEQNKDREFPLSRSKFHRLVASFLGMHSMQLLPLSMHEEVIWGYVHTSDLDIKAFDFWLDRQAGVTVTARLRPPRSREDAEARAQNAAISRKMLKAKRSTGERLCPSAIGIAAMIYGPEVDQPGARVDAIVKLLTAAEWWGGGPNGWHQLDETWLCTDKKDTFGRIVRQQGRILWRVAGHKRVPEVRPDGALAASVPKGVQPLVRMAAAGAVRLLPLLTLLLVLWTLRSVQLLRS